jgi:hypothetical protein
MHSLWTSSSRDVGAKVGRAWVRSYTLVEQLFPDLGFRAVLLAIGDGLEGRADVFALAQMRSGRAWR